MNGLRHEEVLYILENLNKRLLNDNIEVTKNTAEEFRISLYKGDRVYEASVTYYQSEVHDVQTMLHNLYIDLQDEFLKQNFRKMEV